MPLTLLATATATSTKHFIIKKGTEEARLSSTVLHPRTQAIYLGILGQAHFHLSPDQTLSFVQSNLIKV